MHDYLVRASRCPGKAVHSCPTKWMTELGLPMTLSMDDWKIGLVGFVGFIVVLAVGVALIAVNILRAHAARRRNRIERLSPSAPRYSLAVRHHRLLDRRKCPCLNRRVRKLSTAAAASYMCRHAGGPSPIWLPFFVSTSSG